MLPETRSEPPVYVPATLVIPWITRKPASAFVRDMAGATRFPACPPFMWTAHPWVHISLRFSHGIFWITVAYHDS